MSTASSPYGNVLEPPFPSNGPRVAWFIENYCTFTDGDRWGKPMRLEAWQRWVLNEMFRINPTTGLRRYKQFLLMIPRGNGKSALASALGFYFLAFDNEGAPEVYSTAWGEEQARAVFEPAQKIWESSTHLQSTTQKFAKAFTCPTSGGSWKITSRIADSKQGKKPHALLNDEYHVHPTAELRDAFRRGMHKRKQPMALDITTEGRDKDAPLGELQRMYFERGEHEQIHDYLHVYRMDTACMIRWGIPWDTEGVDIEDLDVIRACNPGEWIDPEELRREFLYEDPNPESWWIRYHLNGLARPDDEEGIPPEMWEACAESKLRLEAGQDVWIGVDVGYRSDCSAVVAAGWVGERLVLEPYVWEPPRDEGLELDIEATVVAKIEQLVSRYKCRAIVADPPMIPGYLQDWQKRGLPIREFRFGMKEIGPASIRFLEAIQNVVLAHPAHQMLDEHVANLRVEERGDAWRYGKPRLPNGKIDKDRKNDAGIAAILAVDEALGGETKTPYSDRGLLIV